ncbi:MAG: 4-hydroxy-3-methylbut-2-enyl diphosphate reductase [Sumerlaeia bacterium]
MTESKTYYKSSLGLKKEITGLVAQDYASDFILELKSLPNGLEIPSANCTFFLAKEFGFCYGVDKAIDMAYEARQKFPDRRIFLLTEIIHNPRVNKRMVDMGLIFLSGQYQHKNLTRNDIQPNDVVLIPAFGTAAADFDFLREKGAVIVDTTCGSVVHVWKRVEKYAREGFTSVVHGKYYHEETIATVSMAQKQGGHFLVVRNQQQVNLLIRALLSELPAGELLNHFHPEAYSPGFDPATHLLKLGVANQTTMLASESLAIAAQIGDAVARRDGLASRIEAENFRSFDTICSATQDRQDAVKEMLSTQNLDLMIIVGGYNSSNTTHLLQVSSPYCPAYHIDDVSELLSADAVRHLPYGAAEPIRTENWLPQQNQSTQPLRVGFTAGASTPNRVILDVMMRFAELRGGRLPEIQS